MQAPTSRYSDGLEKLKTDKFNVINEQEDFFVSNIRQILLSVEYLFIIHHTQWKLLLPMANVYSSYGNEMTEHCLTQVQSDIHATKPY